MCLRAVTGEANLRYWLRVPEEEEYSERLKGHNVILERKFKLT